MVRPIPIKRKPMLKTAETKAPEKSTKKTEKAEKTKSSKSLPQDVYEDEITPHELVVDETRKFVLSVKRGGDFGLPMCDVRQYQTTDLYTGFTKKGINFPIELLPDLIDQLQEVYNASEDKGLLN